MSRSLTLRDIGLGVGVAFVWGMGVVFAKAAIESFPPILLMCFRFAVAAALLVWFVPLPHGHFARLFWIAVVSAAIQYALVFTGLKWLDASIAVLIIQLEVPILTIVGVLFLGESTTLRKWAGIALAFAGVGLIAGVPEVAAAWGAVIMVILGSVSWAIGQAMVRGLHGLDGLTTTAWVAVMATPQLLIMSLIFETGQVEAIGSAGLTVWATVVYLGILMTAVGYGMWYSLLRRNPVSQVAPFLLLLPVFGVVGSYLVLGETLATIAILGGLIVIAGVALILTDKASD
ncbi:MAG: DMT family transporter [Paracoccaceae bacterium]